MALVPYFFCISELVSQYSHASVNVDPQNLETDFCVNVLTAFSFFFASTTSTIIVFLLGNKAFIVIIKTPRIYPVGPQILCLSSGVTHINGVHINETRL